MSVISVYDINNYIKQDSELVSIAGREMEIFPAAGYEDALPPFIVYVYSPGIPNVEAFWFRTDVVIYAIYDDDITRLFDINERIMEIFGAGDQVAQPGGVVGTDTRILSTEINSIQVAAAEERDGWFRSDLEFIIHHVKR
jgi:hypothetical protein